MVSLFVSNIYDYGFMEWMRLFMGVFFVVFAGFKFAGYKMYVMMFPMYDLIAMRSKIYTKAYPFIELAFGLSYLFDLFAPWRDVVVFAVMTIGLAGVVKSLLDKKKIRCACLGNIIKLPLSKTTLTEDALMAVMALGFLV